MCPLDVTSSSDRVQFDDAVRKRSWEWLLALRRRFNVDLQIVNDAHVPLLGQGGAPLATNIEALLASGVPGLRVALATALRTRTPQAVRVERVQTVCLPLTMGDVVGGVLVLARRSAEQVTPERARSELELIGLWLSGAIEAHLSSPLSAEENLDRPSALCHLLGDAAARGSDRESVAAFAEALAVWHDLELYGYVETPRGEFVREVSLIGADPSRSPAVIHRAALPESVQMARLSKADGERLGFPTAQDLIVTRLADDVGSWLLVISGTIPAEGSTRLGLYVALLEQSIARAIDVSRTHAITSMMARLLDDSVEPEQQARQALAGLQEVLRMASVALSVTTAAGTPLVRVGSAATAEMGDPAEGGSLVLVRRVPQRYTMAVALASPAGRHVTRQEKRVAHASADLLESWAGRTVRQSKGAGERRAAFPSFDEVFERFARQSLEYGVAVTAVVLSFSDALFEPGSTQGRIGRIREQVRAADLVGRFDEGEIGMLLYNTVREQAKSVVARLREVLEGADEMRLPVPASVGYASRAPGEPLANGLAREAREDAFRHGDES